MDFVYLVIRDLDSYYEAEIDVFTDFDLAHEWAATLRASGKDVVEQEQAILGTADIAAMKQTLSS